jgi:ubiquinone/menaquinone biosynthesis C-methylase UbiE
MSSIPPGENSYIVDQESGVEMARLVNQDLMITSLMDGLFPPDLNLSSVRSVLDVACGPGGWVQEVAFAHRDKHVIGIDISAAMLDYAWSRARMQGLNNAEFRAMDATSPLKFPDASFDFVNARLLAGFMWKEAWPQLVNECFRITRPGGFIRLTETDSLGVTNSLALEKHSLLITRALYRTGRIFCADENANHFGITPMLGAFLQQAGYHDIRERAYILNFSVGSQGHLSHYKNLQVAMKLLQPFLLKLNLTTQEELDQLYNQMLLEMSHENFRGIWYFTSVHAQKPS